MTKLLIVDDSALMRRQLVSLFEEAGGFQIHQARNGREAVEENRSFMPDVVTLDINMPEMDGITALSLIMAERPVPVVMLSSLTEKGALATFEALNLGAVDYIAKPGGTISLSLGGIKEELVNKVRAAALAKIKEKKVSSARGLAQRLRDEREKPVPRPMAVRRGVAGEGLVIIGVSTGGPRTLEDILPLFPANFPWPVLVAQHMPSSFTRPFAERLNAMCELTVQEADHPMPIEAGIIYIGKGGADMLVVQRGGKLTVVPKPENKEYLWHPSVELLGRSVLEHCDPSRVVGVMLTGMGYDGADAFAEIKKRGGRTIAESRESAVVFGMPAELIERGGASVVLDSDKIAAQINVWAGR
ncbi:chemotaxis-specific protein-glutamate methyltransferase CheB [Candidatus Symbiobacter mobilis]|uniref:Protein-glutamate methylesterase/protein-glutamine glutaminase n=1 Tax=Candidatus Symbiobacter mobilis CR TaxID=946483 RepID=U5NAJ6_9BURK|nr:chemotaxis-specific protein-glutamate methyltransferase CheB [Candidatus Symbiobacter mobilis]AGX87283.1 chemotaxis response regulator CheB [Candidatus Symbiobacter mobilis CR]